jgi:hypothetical protein
MHAFLWYMLYHTFEAITQDAEAVTLVSCPMFLVEWREIDEQLEMSGSIHANCAKFTYKRTLYFSGKFF